LIERVRRASASPRIPLTYVDTHRQRREYEAQGRRKQVLRVLRPLIKVLRASRLARWIFRKSLYYFFTPHLYDDLFDQYQPDLIVANTAGWRLDQYLLREANRHGIKTATVIVGWDNPSSQGLPGAFIDYAVVWSDIHKRELVDGIDWPAEKVHIGGMPLYDGYIQEKWIIPRDEYFALHGLDPEKKVIAFAATALSITPNLHLIEILVDMIAKQQLSVATQLLIRLHPNHFKPMPHYEAERKAIFSLAQRHPDVHIVEPAALGGGLERYSGEDFPEKASMLKHCDVMATVYSTMVVEAALHDTPFVSVCINIPGGWGEKFWIPLSDVPGWPTASRVNEAKAGRTVLDADALLDTLNAYLENPALDAPQRKQFIHDELTYIQGESTPNVAAFLYSLI